MPETVDTVDNSQETIDIMRCESKNRCMEPGEVPLSFWRNPLRETLDCVVSAPPAPGLFKEGRINVQENPIILAPKIIGERAREEISPFCSWHFSWLNPLFLWWFMKMLHSHTHSYVTNYQRVEHKWPLTKFELYIYMHLFQGLLRYRLLCKLSYISANQLCQLPMTANNLSRNV